MSTFERYLTVWVALCIAAGVALGYAVPGAFHAIAALEIARVNLVVAVLIWPMIVPMLVKIEIAVPVMLSVVAIVNRSKGWYERDLDPAPVGDARRV